MARNPAEDILAFGDEYIPLRIYPMNDGEFTHTMPGKYNVDINLLVEGAVLCSSSLNFTAVASVDVNYFSNFSFYKLPPTYLLPGNEPRICPLKINKKDQLAYFLVGLTPPPVPDEKMEFIIEPYGDTDELPVGISFNKIYDQELDFEPNLIEDGESFQMKISIKIKGVIQAFILLEIL